MTAAAGAPRCAGAEAQRVCDASVGRYWKILNPASTHPATGEQLLLCWQHSRLLPSLFGCHSHHCCHPHHCCLQASRWPSSWCPHTRRCCWQRPPAASPSAACLPPSTCGSPRTATQVGALLAAYAMLLEAAVQRRAICVQRQPRPPNASRVILNCCRDVPSRRLSHAARRRRRPAQVDRGGAQFGSLAQLKCMESADRQQYCNLPQCLSPHTALLPPLRPFVAFAPPSFPVPSIPNCRTAAWRAPIRYCGTPLAPPTCHAPRTSPSCPAKL